MNCWLTAQHNNLAASKREICSVGHKGYLCLVSGSVQSSAINGQPESFELKEGGQESEFRSQLFSLYASPLHPSPLIPSAPCPLPSSLILCLHSSSLLDF
jgi:hypothetical protein